MPVRLVAQTIAALLPGQGSQGQGDQEDADAAEARSAEEMAEAIAEEIMETFKEQWSEAVENLATADAAFDDLEVI